MDIATKIQAAQNFRLQRVHERYGIKSTSTTEAIRKVFEVLYNDPENHVAGMPNTGREAAVQAAIIQFQGGAIPCFVSVAMTRNHGIFRMDNH